MKQMNTETEGTGCCCGKSKDDDRNNTQNTQNQGQNSTGAVKPEEKLMHDIYRNVKMGVDSINTLLPKVGDQAMRQDLTSQLLGYQDFTTQTTKLLLDHGETPSEPPIYQKIPAEAGIHMNTMLDRSNSKIAELMINGSVMGIIDTTRALHACKEACPSEISKLANDIIAFEDNNMNRLRAYL